VARTEAMKSERGGGGL